MSDDQETPETNEPIAPTQAQLYDDLRRIGQLEDQKCAIQSEIDERTERLRNAIPTLDPASLLHKMLSASMKPMVEKKSKTNQPAAKKKVATKKAAKQRGS